MKFNSFICQICGKRKGGTNGVNHEKCSLQMQEMNKDKKRKVAKELTFKSADRLASLILRTTA